MSYFNKILNTYKTYDFNSVFDTVDEYSITKALESNSLAAHDFLSLISPKAEQYIESLAQRAHNLTLQYFGKTMQLYTPLYLGNFCENQCLYCGFKAGNIVERKKLSLVEVENEAKFISRQGFQHILILTGSSRINTPVAYIKDCVLLLKKYFSSISIEVYAMTEDEYALLIEAGVDGLTLYHEVYDENVYKKVHVSGPKADYEFRLSAPDRAAKYGMRQINIGALLGLSEWRKEAFFLALHAQYLQETYPETEIGISIPRLRPQEGGYVSDVEVSDKNIVQLVTAMRIFLPRVGITVSTRESAEFRDNILTLGVTRMSAGSTTAVGGHTVDSKQSNQFEISDNRSLKDIIGVLKKYNYQPVLHDWMHI